MRKLFQLDDLVNNKERVKIVDWTHLTQENTLFEGLWYNLPEHVFKYYVTNISFEEDELIIYVKEAK